MMKLLGYSILEQIHAGKRTLVYRGIRNADQMPVIVKILSSKYPTVQEITSIKHEYKITKNLELPGIVTPYALESYSSGFALVLEDFAGIPLKKALSISNLTLIDILNIGIKIIKVINQIHSNHIIHKDINPQNIIINLDKKIVKVTDFSIATQLSKEQPNICNYDVIEGTLAYISPEQTGRMNRALDYRSDFYSFGVTLYEMLVGELPFSTTDPMELVHSHIAKIPVSPCNKNTNIPKAVSDIVMKLLSKTAEDRYQTALGIQADLERCLQFLEESNYVPNFTIGQQDFSTQLLIPQKLYGREQEVAMLIQAFERVSHGATELMLVGGYSGIGKSSLVSSIHKPIVKQNGYFIAGKFDQFQRDVPYVSLIQAFRGLVQQILTQSHDKIEEWRQKLLQAFGNNGQVVIDVIPEVELIVGKQPPIPVLGANESQYRFNRVFKEFVRIFATHEHPLVIFLDDLQWADVASLNLINLIVTDTSIEYLLVIGAYRDNEVNPAHPFMLTIDDIRSHHGTINTIILKNLELTDVNALLSETFNCSPEKSLSLAELCMSKTDANPFFLTQLLKSLFHSELVKFNLRTYEWEWDIQEITLAAITDNVVELMIGKISNLSVPTQNILKLAACIGNRFNLTVLATVNKNSHFITASQLWEAIQSGLILPLSDTYKTPRVLEEFDEVIEYRFLHDRVQQAAYALIPEENKKIVHLEIGRLLLASNNQDIEDTIFDIVSHLNIGQDLITSQREKIKLAELNLIAAKKAKASTAYTTSIKLLEKGIKLLSSPNWNNNYELTFKLYRELAECKYLTGNFQEAEELFKIILENSSCIFDKAEIYQLKMNCDMTQGNFSNGIHSGYEALKLFDLHLPESEQELEIILQQEFKQVELNLNKRNIADLFNAAEMTKRYQQVRISILIHLWTLAYIAAKSNLLDTAAVKLVNLSLQYGNANTSSFGYAIYGMILGIQGDYSNAYEFGSLAVKLNEKYNHPGLVGKVYNIFCHMHNPYKNHLKTNIPLYKKSYLACMESGDLLYGVWAIYFLVYTQFVIGTQLDKVSEQVSKYLISAQQIQDQNMILAFLSLQHTIWRLQGITTKKNAYHDELFHEEEALKFWQSNSFDSGINWHSYLKIQLLYLNSDYTEACNIAKQAEEKLIASFGFFTVTEYNFYYSLSLAAIYPTASAAEKEEIITKLSSNQEKMKLWADNCPDNYLHKYLLVKAEIARITNNQLEAIHLYDDAIEAAQASEYIQNLAIANELAAKFYLEMGKVKLARPYFADADYYYTRWGALSKVQDLEARYSEFITTAPCRDVINRVSTINHTTTSGNNSNFLDLASIIKASQTLASEIVKDKLLDKLIKIVIENTGADYGLLITVEDDKLFIEAAGFAEQDEVLVKRVPFNQTSLQAPSKIINYVQLTQSSIVLTNATQEELYAEDDYIQKNKPLSILCTSILHQGKLIGIIYLENSLAAGAFTSQRLEVLKLLCSQISISLQNARLYENLDNLVVERTQELQEKNTSLKEQAVHLEQTLHSLKCTQNQLIQNEKMSSLGQLVAGVAHEINNPVNFIHGNLSHLTNYALDLLKLLNLYQHHFPNPPLEIQTEAEEIDLDFLKNDFVKIVQSMQVGTKRIRDIVLSLRNFSRLDEAEFKQVDIHEGIDSTLMILQHNFKTKSGDEIQVIKDYSNLLLVDCYPGQLNQVFMNIIANGIDALEECADKPNYKPTIIIHTQLTLENNVLISITDNGIGIPEELRHQLFDPFFTTKEVGKGTGLGLSISYQIIVEKHGGKLWCDSAPGKGTKFFIEIPSSHR
ncbi:serine/threonine protein kinase [Dulcicalothrix desertica PCC 7102]|uniref:histidine kinase n=1 Tax=Dulcicalothrix desertica PCC 7102 TaxID=232991 RepID=A0A433UKL4_9CYAN|nr:ATP-binding sensor histidine kinase [Dulcicalothrix desertica]RUS94387.1 serine/threonine protein kinase [Dulcicalothrix desertica PCC 7102]TWH54986.1 putative ATPase [Dulcicalothrix desertica PCC 7102]